MGDTTQILQLNVRLSISVPMMEKAASGPTVFSVLMELSSTRVSSFATGGSTSTAQRLRVSMDSMRKTQPRLLQLVEVQLLLLVIATVQEVDRQGTNHSGGEREDGGVIFILYKDGWNYYQ